MPNKTSTKPSGEVDDGPVERRRPGPKPRRSLENRVTARLTEGESKMLGDLVKQRNEDLAQEVVTVTPSDVVRWLIVKEHERRDAEGGTATKVSL